MVLSSLRALERTGAGVANAAPGPGPDTHRAISPCRWLRGYLRLTSGARFHAQRGAPKLLQRDGFSGLFAHAFNRLPSGQVTQYLRAAGFPLVTCRFTSVLSPHLPSFHRTRVLVLFAKHCDKSTGMRSRSLASEAKKNLTADDRLHCVACAGNRALETTPEHAFTGHRQEARASPLTRWTRKAGREGYACSMTIYQFEPRSELLHYATQESDFVRG
jgi:hypothetical protein